MVMIGLFLLVSFTLFVFGVAASCSLVCFVCFVVCLLFNVCKGFGLVFYLVFWFSSVC